jgi:hypothetical protein
VAASGVLPSSPVANWVMLTTTDPAAATSFSFVSPTGMITDLCTGFYTLFAGGTAGAWNVSTDAGAVATHSDPLAPTPGSSVFQQFALFYGNDGDLSIPAGVSVNNHDGSVGAYAFPGAGTYTGPTFTAAFMGTPLPASPTIDWWAYGYWGTVGALSVTLDWTP